MDLHDIINWSSQKPLRQTIIFLSLNIVVWLINSWKWVTGIIISILRIITKASLPQTPKGLRISAHLYFMVATIFLLCCIVFSNLQYKLLVMPQYHQRLPQENNLCSGIKFGQWQEKLRG